MAATLGSPDMEPGRRAVLIKTNVAHLQESFTSVEKVIKINGLRVLQDYETGKHPGNVALHVLYRTRLNRSEPTK